MLPVRIEPLNPCNWFGSMGHLGSLADRQAKAPPPHHHPHCRPPNRFTCLTCTARSQFPRWTCRPRHRSSRSTTQGQPHKPSARGPRRPGEPAACGPRRPSEQPPGKPQCSPQGPSMAVQCGRSTAVERAGPRTRNGSRWEAHPDTARAGAQTQPGPQAESQSPMIGSGVLSQRDGKNHACSKILSQ